MIFLSLDMKMSTSRSNHSKLAPAPHASCCVAASIKLPSCWFTSAKAFCGLPAAKYSLMAKASSEGSYNGFWSKETVFITSVLQHCLNTIIGVVVRFSSGESAFDFSQAVDSQFHVDYSANGLCCAEFTVCKAK